MSSSALVGLDVGEKRIGVSVADTGIRIAVPFSTVEVDGNEVQAIAEIVLKERADTIVVGYPRNQQGEATSQTEFVEEFTKKLEYLDRKIVFQDESLTSVMAEQRLKSYGRPYAKGDIDAQAATIILQDYLELNHG
ncbi:Holliday junction resolvase [Candidatus Saccharibacteria bacterium 49-20]|nr:MAG: Holliday junction resolvase [Candidatus Saccharibacteria bacterium 49-20]